MTMSQKQKSSFIITFSIIIGVIGLTLGIYFGLKPNAGAVLRQQYPYCASIMSGTFRDNNVRKMGDGRCDRTLADNVTYGLNSFECGYDLGDCHDFNTQYVRCNGEGKHPSLLSDLGRDRCKKEYNIPECGYDLGLCTKFNNDYPKCKTATPGLVENGICDYDKDVNTEECGWDGADCLIPILPKCTGTNTDWYNDTRCNLELMRKECNFDGDDCKEYMLRYPNCGASKPYFVGDGFCDNFPKGEYNNFDCDYDGGDCDKFNNRWGYQVNDCLAEETLLVGDGNCHNDQYINSQGCNFDDADCIEFNQNPKYSKCNVFNAWALGNGKCEHIVMADPSLVGKKNYTDEFTHNTAECDYDGGDCIEFNEKYPGCKALNPEKVGGTQEMFVVMLLFIIFIDDF